MAAELAHDSEMMRIRECLNRGRNIGEEVSGHRCFDRLIEGLLGHLQKVLNLRRNISNRHGYRGVPEETIKDDSEIETNHVAVTDHTLGRRNAVNHFTVDRNADAGGKASV